MLKDVQLIGMMCVIPESICCKMLIVTYVERYEIAMTKERC